MHLPSRTTVVPTVLVVAAVTALASAFVAPAPATTATSAPAAIEPTSLGTPLTDINAIGGDVTAAPDGTPLAYTVTMGEPARLTAADPRTGDIVVSEPLPGASSSYSVVALDSGDVYVSTNSNGRLYRYTWGEAGVEDLGSVLPGQTFAWDIAEGPDGRIYGTTFPGARLYAFDPATGEFQDYGAVADDTQQARTIDAFGGLLYVGTMTNAHLLAVDPATGSMTEIPLPPESNPDDPLTSVFDVNAAGDKLYVRIGTDIKYSPLYEFDPATQTWGRSIDTVAGLELPDPGPSGELYVMRNNVLTAWDPAGGTAEPTPVRYEGRVYNYRGVGWVDLGDPEWPGLTLVGYFWRGEMWRYNPQTGRGDVFQTDMQGEPIDILSLEGSRDGGIWAGGYLGGFGHVDPATGDRTFFRFSQTEQLVDDGDHLWIGAYPDARGYRFDPDAPYNDPDYAPGPPGTPVNPVKLWDFRGHADPQDRVFALLRVGDRLLGSTGPKGATFGGSLAISDIATGETTFVDGISTDRALTSLAAAPDGNVVYAGTWIYGGTGSPTPPQTEATVVALDPATGEKLWEVTPVPGTPAYVATTVDAAGRLWTLANAALVELDPATGDVVRTITLDDVDLSRGTWPHQLGTVEVDPDSGLLYASVAGDLYRIQPESGAVETLGAFPYRTFSLLGDGSIAMASGPELFHWVPPAADTTPPTVTITTTGIPGDLWPYLEITAHDDGSGVATIEVALDGGPLRPYTGPVRIRPGRHLVEVRATDAAGNTAQVSESLVARPPRG